MKQKLMLVAFILIGAVFVYLSLDSFQRGKTLIGSLQIAAAMSMWIRGIVEWRKSGQS
jgi:hypothetical protein